jgi:hypothetical protein
MKKILGFVLIVLGVLAGISSGTLTTNARHMDPAERFGQAVGGELLALVLVVGGFLLVRSADKKR